MTTERRSVADIVGPWVDPPTPTGLTERCKAVWGTPIGELTNQQLATFLRQRIAVIATIDEAQSRIATGFEDDTELDDGELLRAIEHAQQGGGGQAATRSESE